MPDDPSSPSRLTTAPSKPSLTDRLFGLFRPAREPDLRTDLEDALSDDAQTATDFSAEERAMLRNILRLRETRAEDVMIPRADIIAVDENRSIGEALAQLRTSGHSRLPVYAGSLDQPIGMVHIKDVVSYLIDRARAKPSNSRKRASARKVASTGEAAVETLKALQAEAGFDARQIDLDVPLSELDITRNLLFVPASMPATDLMAQMQAQRMQMALVIDEYGGTDGLISLEDLIETVVGDIEDEHDDEAAPAFEPIGDGGYVADARIPLENVQLVFGDLFSVDDDDAEEIDTLGGLLFTALGRIPVRGELIDAVEGLDIEVTDADPRRIKRLKVYPAGLRRRDPNAPRRLGRPSAHPADAGEEKGTIHPLDPPASSGPADEPPKAATG